MTTTIGFTGNFDISKWTLTAGTGSINTDNVPANVTLVSGNSSSSSYTTMTIHIITSGTIQFSYNSTTTDENLSYDPFGYMLNGTYFPLVNSGTSVSGTFNVNVSINDAFGFYTYTTTGTSGSSTTIIDDFTFNANGISLWTSQSILENAWQSITYGNGLFVAIANSGVNNRVIISSDGINWTGVTYPEDNLWTCVTYGNGMFVAVSSTGRNQIMTSLDGIIWTARYTTESINWESVTYGNGLFVAVASSGRGNRTMRSTDGITWTAYNASINNMWNSITYGNGLFVAVARSGTDTRVMTSPNGISWTTRKSSTDNRWRSVTYGNGLFVAVADSGTNTRVMTSPDGINWTTRSTNLLNRNWKSVTYGNGLFVAVANGVGITESLRNYAMISADGINWVQASDVNSVAWMAVAFGNGQFVAVSQTGTQRAMIATTIAPNIGPFVVPSKQYPQYYPFIIEQPTTNSSGTFSYTSSNPSVATISGSTITVVGAGISNISAIQTSDFNYTVGRTSTTFTVIPLPNEIIVAPVFNKKMGNVSFNLNANSLNINYDSEPLMYLSNDTDVATVNSSGFVTIVGEGSTTINISQEAGSNYSSAFSNTIINVGPAGTSVTVVPFIFDISRPLSVAFDLVGDLFISTETGLIYKVVLDHETGEIVDQYVFADASYGTTGIRFIAFDNDWNLCFTNSNEIRRLVLNPYGEIVSSEVVISGLSGPQGLAFDNDGNIYYAQQGNNTIRKAFVDPNTGAITSTTIIADNSSQQYINGPFGVHLDSSQNVFTANWYRSSILKTTMDPNTGLAVSNETFVSDFPAGFFDLVFDSQGNMYASDGYGNQIYKIIIDPETGAFMSKSILVSGLNGAYGIARDSNGDLFCVNYSGNMVSKIYLSELPNNIIVSPTEYTKPFGSEPFNLNATSTDTETPLTYFSTNTTVATVDEMGEVTVGMIGEAKIYINQYGSASVTVTITVVETPSPTETSTAFILGIKGPVGLAFDSSGSLYCVSEAYANWAATKTTINADGTIGETSVWKVLEPWMYQIAFDSQYNMFSFKQSGNTIYKTFRNPDGSANETVSFYTQNRQIMSIAFDRYGNLYVLKQSNEIDILTIDDDGEILSVQTNLPNFGQGSFIAFDSNGDLFFAGDNIIYKTLIDQYTGLAISTSTFVSPISSDVYNSVWLSFDNNGDMYVTCNAVTPGIYKILIQPDGSAGTITKIMSSNQAPKCTVFDSDNNMYYSLARNGTVMRLLDGESVPELFLLGLDEPTGLAVDSQYNLYGTMNKSNIVTRNIIDVEFGKPGPTTVFVSELLNSPEGIVLDSKGTMYVANAGNNTITKTLIDSETGEAISTTVFVSSGLNYPTGLTVDENDQLYCCNYNSNNIVKITIDENGDFVSMDVLTTENLSGPVSIAFSKQGFLYCANYVSETLVKIIIENGVTVSSDVVFSGLGRPYSILFDRSNTLYCSNSYLSNGTSTISKMTLKPNGDIKTYSTFVVSELFSINTIGGCKGIALDYEGNLYCCSSVTYNITNTLALMENQITTGENEYTKTYGNMPFNLNASSSNDNYVGQPLSYVSSNTDVATVNAFGLVTLNSYGQTIITISQDSGYGYFGATKDVIINVLESTISNPVVIETSAELDYLMTTTATYGELDSSVQLTSDLVTTTTKTLISNGTIIVITVNNSV